MEKAKECYASTFTDRAIYYRVNRGFDHMTVALSAAAQMMVFSRAAGVMSTVDLVTGNDEQYSY
ncbi:MAG: PEP/pyruvate-binding domain-containing protein [Veillonella sp.]